MVKSAQGVAQKWLRGVSGSAEAYKQGVSEVTVAPGEAAAQNLDLMIAKLIAMRDDGSLAEAMRSVSLEQWKQAAIQKGAQRLASGAQASVGDMENFLIQFLPFAEQVSKNLPSRGTLEQNIERMNQNVRQLATFRYRRRRR